MAMKKGAAAAEASSKSFASGRLQEQFFKDGDEMFVRFLTEVTDWPVVEYHTAVPTKPKPENWKADKWPSAMSAACANDVNAFQGETSEGEPDGVWEEGFGNCYIHANYADQLDNFKKPRSNSRPITFALAVLRERDGNKMKDKSEEYSDDKGNKRQIPALRIIAQPWRSFFSQVHAGAFEDDSVCNRDFRITKSGRDFTISPLSITANHHPAVKDHPTLGTADATPSWKFYEEILALVGADLEGWIRHRASEEWMKLWFWPGEWDAKKDDDTEADNAGSAVGDSGSSGVDELSDEDRARFDAYKAKLEEKQKAAASSS